MKLAAMNQHSPDTNIYQQAGRSPNNRPLEAVRLNGRDARLMVTAPGGFIIWPAARRTGGRCGRPAAVSGRPRSHRFPSRQVPRALLPGAAAPHRFQCFRCSRPLGAPVAPPPCLRSPHRQTECLPRTASLLHHPPACGAQRWVFCSVPRPWLPGKSRRLTTRRRWYRRAAASPVHEPAPPPVGRLQKQYMSVS